MAIGVALEGPEVIHEARRVLCKIREKSRPWITLVALIGWILVALGVLGEGISEALVSRADGNIQAFNDKRLAEITREAGDASTSADVAKTSANAAKASATIAADSARSAVVISKDAARIAGMARKEADAFERQISLARADLARFRKEASARRLTDEQKKAFRQILEKTPSPVAVGSVPEDLEARDLAGDFIDVMKDSQKNPVPVMQVPLSLYGVVIGIAEKEGRDSAAYKTLQSALGAIGYSPHEVIFKVGEGFVNPPVQTHVLYLLIGPHPPVNSDTRTK